MPKNKINIPTCAVGSCKPPYPIESFHVFPKDRKLWLIWQQYCLRGDSFIPNEKSRICSRHFRPEDFGRDLKFELMGGKKKYLLKPGTVPCKALRDAKTNATVPQPTRRE